MNSFSCELKWSYQDALIFQLVSFSKFVQEAARLGMVGPIDSITGYLKVSCRNFFLFSTTKNKVFYTNTKIPKPHQNIKTFAN